MAWWQGLQVKARGGAMHTTGNVSCGFPPAPVQERQTADRQHLLIGKKKKLCLHVLATAQPPT